MGCAVGQGGETWRTSKGPLSRAKLALDRIAWFFVTPFVVKDDRNEEIKLTEASPAMVAKLLKEGATRDLERKLADKIVQDIEPENPNIATPYRGKRAYLGAVAEFVASSKNSPLEKGCVKKAVCNGLWTNERAAASGYSISPLCALCGAAPDTPHHRLYTCSHPSVVADRERVATRQFLQLARNAARNDPFFIRAIAPDPAH